VIELPSIQKANHDENTRPQPNTATFRVDPLAPLSVYQDHAPNDRWREAQIEEPERWDGMS
jgi:hypothetical protein